MSDPEIDAMSSVATALASLEEEQQGRVLRWAAERYGVRLPKVRARPEDNDNDNDNVSDVGVTADDPEFPEFGDLFAACDPKTNEDKALVAAYWRQVHLGEESWSSASLTKDLRNLGHGIPNITDAMTSNMRRRPQRVIQLKKSGSARQARKTYKVTREGLVHVQGMFGHGG